jgi:single-strand DNA-binding protein
MKIKSIILTLILLLTFTLVSCDGDDNGSNNGVRINFWSIGDQYSMQAYKALVDEYNATQGVIDGVSVKISFKQDQSDTHYAICGSAKSQVDVLGVSDRKFFNNAKEGYYTNLDELYANESLRTKDANGNKTTSFLPCVCWNSVADNVNKYTKKGSLVGVEGRINQRSYKKADGTTAQVIEVIADTVQFLGPKADSAPTADVAPMISENESIDITEDDLPF